MLLTHLSQGESDPRFSAQPNREREVSPDEVCWTELPLGRVHLTSLAPAAKQPEGNSAACLKPDGMSPDLREDQPSLLCCPSLARVAQQKKSCPGRVAMASHYSSPNT